MLSLSRGVVMLIISYSIVVHVCSCISAIISERTMNESKCRVKSGNFGQQVISDSDLVCFIV